MKNGAKDSVFEDIDSVIKYLHLINCENKVYEEYISLGECRYNNGDSNDGALIYRNKIYNLSSNSKISLFNKINAPLKYLKSIPKDLSEECINHSIKKNNKKYIFRIVNDDKIVGITSRSKYKYLKTTSILDIIKEYCPHDVVPVSVLHDDYVTHCYFANNTVGTKIGKDSIHTGFGIINSEVGLCTPSLYPIVHIKDVGILHANSKFALKSFFKDPDRAILNFFSSSKIYLFSNLYVQGLLSINNVLVHDFDEWIKKILSLSSSRIISRKEIRKIYGGIKKDKKTLYDILCCFLIASSSKDLNLIDKIKLYKLNSSIMENLYSTRRYVECEEIKRHMYDTPEIQDGFLKEYSI